MGFLDRLGRKLALNGFAGLCLLTGAALLTGSGYIVLVEMFDQARALGILGAVYLGLGLVALALGGREKRSAPPTKEQTMPDIIAAFMTGFTQGSTVSKNR